MIKFKAEVFKKIVKRKRIPLKRAKELKDAGLESQVTHVNLGYGRYHYFEYLPPVDNPALKNLRRKLKKLKPVEVDLGDRVAFRIGFEGVPA